MEWTDFYEGFISARETATVLKWVATLHCQLSCTSSCLCKLLFIWFYNLRSHAILKSIFKPNSKRTMWSLFETTFRLASGSHDFCSPFVITTANRLPLSHRQPHPLHPLFSRGQTLGFLSLQLSSGPLRPTSVMFYHPVGPGHYVTQTVLVSQPFPPVALLKKEEKHILWWPLLSHWTSLFSLRGMFVFFGQVKRNFENAEKAVQFEL